MEPSELRARWLLTYSRLKDNSKFYESEDNGLRSVRWKVDLGVLPRMDIKSWVPSSKKSRENYNTLKRKYIEEPRLLVTNPSALKNKSKMNPLAPDSDNPWTQYFQDGELRKVILQDVERTFPDIELFREERIHSLMTDVLFIYCKLNPELSYRQGMHELLAPLLYAISNDSRSIKKAKDANSFLNTEEGEALWSVCDPTYLEQDSYALFDKLMLSANKFYELPDPDEAARLARAHRARSNMNRNNNGGKLNNNRIEQQKNRVRAMSYPPRTTNPVLSLCYKIHYELLAACDPELFQHLEKMEIEPQLFGLRWLRLLFSREMNFPSTLQLWDGLFTPNKSSQDANSEPLGLVGYVALAMLLYVRDEIVNHDYSITLHKLMRFPILKSVPTLLRQAQELQANTNSTVGYRVVTENYKLKGKAEDLVHLTPFPNSANKANSLPPPPQNAMRGRTHSTSSLKFDHLQVNQLSIYSKPQHAASTSSLLTATSENKQAEKPSHDNSSLILNKVRELDVLLISDLKQSLGTVKNFLTNQPLDEELSKALNKLQIVTQTLNRRVGFFESAQVEELPSSDTSFWKFGYQEPTSSSGDEQWEIVSGDISVSIPAVDTNEVKDMSTEVVEPLPKVVIAGDEEYTTEPEPTQTEVSDQVDMVTITNSEGPCNIEEGDKQTGTEAVETSTVKDISEKEIEIDLNVKHSETTGSVVDIDMDIQSNNSILTQEDEIKSEDEVDTKDKKEVEVETKEQGNDSTQTVSNDKCEDSPSHELNLVKSAHNSEPVPIESTTKADQLDEKVQEVPQPAKASKVQTQIQFESSKKLDFNNKPSSAQSVIDDLITKTQTRQKSTDKLPTQPKPQDKQPIKPHPTEKPKSNSKSVEKGKLKEFDWLFGTPPKPLTDKKLKPTPDITTTLQQLQSKELDRSLSASKLEVQNNSGWNSPTKSQPTASTSFQIKSPSVDNPFQFEELQKPNSSSKLMSVVVPNSTTSTPQWTHPELDSPILPSWSTPPTATTTLPKSHPIGATEDVFDNPW